ncbi:MAG: pentapeptide repeat-containing protein [Nostoc sp. DedQUE12a]|nr:pentapeptide repeat-containing protein [Nostoc sp. DedQUE12a]
MNNDIRGILFNQENLVLNLTNKVAGQKKVTKIILILLILISCFIIGIFVGYTGAVTSLQVFIGKKARLEYLSMILLVVVWVTTYIFGNLKKSFVTVIISFFTVIVIPGVLEKSGFLELQPLFFIASPVIIVFFLIVTIVNFFLLRFIITLTKLILTSSLLVVQYLSVFTIVAGAMTGSLIGIAGEVRSPVSEFKDLPIPANVNIGLIFSGVLYALFLILSSWLTNRLRGLPWKHPDLLRSWALIIGSWRGTSWYGLDLSHVNFKNAKLPNSDLRARKLYRTCFQDTQGLERARIDSRYMDLEIPKVQKLLTKPQDYANDKDFSNLNLRGAFLQNAQMRRFNFTDSDLSGADMQSADLRGSIFVRTQVIGVDFTDADLTGICIEDWSVNSQTCFTNVKCDFVYRRLDEDGELSDRFPVNRNFERREFESLYQEVENVIEIIFNEGENWQAALYSLIKLQTEDEQLELQLKGVEKRGDVWVVKVTYNQAYPKQEVEHSLNATVEEIKRQLAAKEQQIYQLEQEKYRILEIAADQAKAVVHQAQALERQSLGNSNNFFISGSNITNLSGSGQIEYGEAAAQVRSIVANSADSRQATAVLQNFLAKLQRQSVATDIETQAELMQQMILTEAQKDLDLKQFLIQQEQQIVSAFPQGILSTAIQSAIAQLRDNRS